MSIDKVNGVSFANVSAVDGVAKNSIGEVNGVEAPSGGVITTNLIQHWDFGDTNFYPGSGTTITDLSDNTKTGSIVNGAVVTTSGSATYVDFDGVNDYAECSIANTFGQNHTTEVWFRMTDLSEIKRVLVVRSYKSNCSSTNGGYAMQFDAINKQIWFTPMAVALYKSNVVSVTANTWYHIVASISGNQLSFYLNGSLVNTRIVSTTRHPACATNLVCRSSAFSNNNGSLNINTCADYDLAELRIYTTSLSSTDVSANYDATKSKYGY